ncbi:hypothetical protein BCR33DRAFT_733853 [Rhizoclosmatium globosum]|uniref:Uncharacterized protein n=1 Tax=Rhizoclosmatium globosum TaxID=329046 RepID=A0A1Y2CX30_9FUNG|nr:hypothetical protein BCR33DRAFT_733853 [Rhizoclosmatium globosum]|eukprot:ORY51589.1 hypothetical protein BCR33DRAFT_733853 [Rhizoclosmatium globosum]
MSLTISVSEVAIEMLSPSQDQIQPFTCFLNLLDSIPSITLLIHFDSPSNTLYVHLVTSLVVFAQTIPSELWVNGFERAIFESFVASETLLVKVLCLEVLLLLCEEVPHEIIAHWLDVCESILASNPQNWILCSLTGTLARNLLEKETVKLRAAGLIEQQRDWLNMSNNLLLGASKWMWTQGGTGRTDATGHLYLDLSLGLWNTFLGMVDDEGASPQQTIGVLEGLSWPIRFLKASLGQVSTADATFEPVADAVVCLLEGMAGAFEVVEGFKNEGVDVIGMLCHLHRTVSELLEVVEVFERSLSLEQKSRVIQTLQEWIVSETNGSYLPQVQSES